jgi:hypothetical protein
MRSRKTTTLARRVALLAAALALTACAAVPGGGSKEEKVRARAAERAEAHVKGDFERSYALTTPTYRKLRDAAAYRRGFGSGAVWEKAEVANVVCEEQRCKVALKVSVKPLIPGRFNDTITVQFEETWLLEDGNWWLHQAL